ncbi:MAG: ATP-binding protein, partial [Candidatus Saccharibacteria bacterium]
MADDFGREPMLDMYIFETNQLLEQLEASILDSEKAGGLEASINEIFRIMHTIKGSSAMMLYDNIATLAHAIEDLFYYIREQKPDNVDFTLLTDLVLQVIDSIKGDVFKIMDNRPADGDFSELTERIHQVLADMKPEGAQQKPVKREEPKTIYYIASDQVTPPQGDNQYSALVFFEEGCEMENVRAFLVVHNLKEVATDIRYYPENIMESEEGVEIIRREGFRVSFQSHMIAEEVQTFLMKIAFVKDVLLDTLDALEIETADAAKPEKKKLEIVLDDFIDAAEKSQEQAVARVQEKVVAKEADASAAKKQSLISVNVGKLDELMDLVGELVISEAMVTQHPELSNLQLENFWKAARQLRKITHDLQDVVMSIRMVPLATTFQKMKRLVRDMSKRVNKEVELVIIGEETEVDKNIIEHISDPLMHLIRNCIDHGLESAEERSQKGKPEAGTVVLEAKNAGGDVWITVKDDGQGLNAERILQKAKERGLLHKPENEMTEREICSLIMLPGFSTKDGVTEFSGRGVGMDVVVKNIEDIGGSVLLDSEPGQGTTISLKLPLTLAIIDGMTIGVGKSRFTVPMTSIQESFRIQEDEVIRDPDDNELILVRGQAYPIVRLHELYDVDTDVKHVGE